MAVWILWSGFLARQNWVLYSVVGETVNQLHCLETVAEQAPRPVWIFVLRPQLGKIVPWPDHHWLFYANRPGQWLDSLFVCHSKQGCKVSYTASQVLCLGFLVRESWSLHSPVDKTKNQFSCPGKATKQTPRPAVLTIWGPKSDRTVHQISWSEEATNLFFCT